MTCVRIIAKTMHTQKDWCNDGDGFLAFLCCLFGGDAAFLGFAFSANTTLFRFAFSANTTLFRFALCLKSDPLLLLHRIPLHCYRQNGNSARRHPSSLGWLAQLRDGVIVALDHTIFVVAIIYTKFHFPYGRGKRILLLRANSAFSMHLSARACTPLKPRMVKNCSAADL